MKTLFLKHDYHEGATELAGKFPARSHVGLTLNADTRVITTEGKNAAALLCGVIPRELERLAYELWRPVDGLISNRATALGTLSLPRSMNKDGRPSPRSGVNTRVLEIVEARQALLGLVDRPCRKTQLTTKHPEMLDGNRRLVELIDELYKQHMPALYSAQWAEVQKAPSWCRLWNTAFTTIYITKALRTAYHADTRNLHGVMTALTPLGNFTGGELVLPRWRIAFAFKSRDLLLFDPQQLHGNLPFKGERLSAALYCAGRVADCGKQMRQRQSTTPTT